MGASETPLEKMRLAAYKRILKQDTEEGEGTGGPGSSRDGSGRPRRSGLPVLQEAPLRSDEKPPINKEGSPSPKSGTTRAPSATEAPSAGGFFKVTTAGAGASKEKSMFVEDHKKDTQKGSSSRGAPFTSSRGTPDAAEDRTKGVQGEKSWKPSQGYTPRGEREGGFQKQTREGPLPSGAPRAEKEGGATPKGGTQESKFRRVAKLLLIIGKEEASQILSRLDEAQIEAITRELASIKVVTQEEAKEVLEEFRALLAHRLGSYGVDRKAQGGPETAKLLLTQAFGEEVAERYLRRAAPQALEKPFQFLEEYRAEQIVPLLKEETIPTLALIFSHLSPPLAARCIKLLDPSIRVQVVRRIAKMQKIAPEVIERVSEALREKIRNVGKVDSPEIDGKATLAEILRHSNPELGEEILEALEEQDPTLGQELKERLYTIEDIVRIEDRVLQEKLRSMGDRDIALLLKGKTHRVVDKIKSNLSSTRRTLVEQEGELLGAVPRRDVAEIERDFLSWLRLGREKGTIPFIDEEDLVT